MKRRQKGGSDRRSPKRAGAGEGHPWWGRTKRRRRAKRLTQMMVRTTSPGGAYRAIPGNSLALLRYQQRRLHRSRHQQKPRRCQPRRRHRRHPRRHPLQRMLLARCGHNCRPGRRPPALCYALILGLREARQACSSLSATRRRRQRQMPTLRPPPLQQKGGANMGGKETTAAADDRAGISPPFESKPAPSPSAAFARWCAAG